MQAGEPGQPVWLVDPNDGTRDYLVGRRGSAVSIGLVHEGRPVLGVVFAFAYPDDEGDLFAWAEGCGPAAPQRPCRVDGAPAGRARTRSTSCSSRARATATRRRTCATRRPRASAAWPRIAHRLALVAAGEAAAATSLFAPCAWDYGGGHALLRAARRTRWSTRTGARSRYDADGDSRSPARLRRRRARGRGALAARPWDVQRAPGATERPARLRARRGDRRRGAARARAGLPAGPGRGRQPGRLVEFAVRGRGARAATRTARGGSSTADAGTARRPAHRRLARWRWRSRARSSAAAATTPAARHGGVPRVAARRGRSTSATPRAAALTGRPRTSSQANGSLMRASPLGVLAHRLRAARRRPRWRARTAR